MNSNVNIYLWRDYDNPEIEAWEVSKQYEPCMLGVKYEKLGDFSTAMSEKELVSRYDVNTGDSSIAQAAWCMKEAKEDDIIVVFQKEGTSLYAIAHALVENGYEQYDDEYPNTIQIKNIVELPEKVPFTLPNVGNPKSFMKKIYGSDARNLLHILGIG